MYGAFARNEQTGVIIAVDRCIHRYRPGYIYIYIYMSSERRCEVASGFALIVLESEQLQQYFIGV